ncbi:unnamed protein product [Schistocephalus solidus]|uniref:C2 domain-containing protein n=1 Tax=Schistocephalus solidus TaxID=70667 RepID=A0A183SUX7_SCHSO|nr:unnamed protein product [Schistocephalus solidus]
MDSYLPIRGRIPTLSLPRRMEEWLTSAPSIICIVLFAYFRGEAHLGEFVEGLGPGQLVGRQVLGMPCLGEIQLSFFDRKGHLEVEVIRARGLQQKNSSKALPTPYVKLHLLDGKQSVEKMRTSAPARRTLDPLFQQQFSFSTSYTDKILQVSVWGEYGRMDKKVFLGMCEIVLDDLNLRSIVFGWYKLFGMIAASTHGSG